MSIESAKAMFSASKRNIGGIHISDKPKKSNEELEKQVDLEKSNIELNEEALDGVVGGAASCPISNPQGRILT